MKPLFSAEAVALPIPTAQPELGQANLPVPAASVSSATPVTALVLPASLVNLDDDGIEKLGSDAGAGLANVTKKYLAAVRAADTGGFGEQLNALVAEAKGLDPKKLQNSGIVSRFLSVFSNAKESMLAQCATVEARMDTMVAELNKHAALHKSRVRDFDDLYNSNFTYYQSLEKDVNRGAEWLAQMAQVLAQPFGTLSVFESQRVAELKRRHDSLQKRIDDLRRGMFLAEQSSVQIRTAQDNARGLTSTFSDIVVVAIPAWRQVFTEFLLQEEQRKSAQVANGVIDATNAAFRAQAELQGQNAEAITRAQQRSLISTETLELRHNKLIEAFETRERIEKEEQARRAAEMPKLLQLQKELATRFIPGYVPEAA
jgi:uncharacterized protein YaaN involved in tellurite resistance